MNAILTFHNHDINRNMKAIRKSDGKVIEVEPQRFMEHDGSMYAPSELDFNVEEAEEVTIDGWVARDDEDVIGESGLYLYPMKPFRKEHWFALPEDTAYNAAMRLDVGLFPNLTFDNSPMEVTITIKPKKKK